MNQILLKGSQALKSIDIDFQYLGVSISVDFLHIHQHKPSESFHLHAHPNFEFHYIARGCGEVGFLESAEIEANDIVRIPAIVKSKRNPELNEFHLKRLHEHEKLKHSRVFELKKGDAFINPPGQFCWHSSSEHDPIVEYGMRFSFSSKMEEGVENNYLYKEYEMILQILSQNMIRVNHESTEIKNLFETIFQEAFYMRPGFTIKIKNDLLSLIIAYSRLLCDEPKMEYFASKVDATVKRLEMIDTFINSNLRSNITIRQLANYVFMSERNLSRFVKKYKGVPVHQYILQWRINKAVSLFSERRFTLSDVAYLTGFSSPFHLSKAIKKYTGKNPTEL